MALDQTPGATAAESTTEFGHLDILIVDDSRFILKVVEDALRQLGLVTVRSADGGQKAIELVKERTPDVVMVDLNMPQMDGVETIAAIARSGCRPSIVLMTAADQAIVNSVSDIVREYDLPMIGHLPKRFRPPDIEALLRRHMERHASAAGPSAAPLEADEVRALLAQGKLTLLYQPKVRMSDRQAIGVECLARIEHPSRGMLPPPLFLPPVLAAGMTGEFDKCVVKTGLAWLKALGDLGVDISLNLNVFVETLHEGWLHDMLVQACQSLAIKPERVVLEVAETRLITEMRATLETLSRIRLKGFGVSIDDFGVGASNLQQLRRLPCTEIKIDRSFVSAACSEEQARTILESSAKLGRSLGLHVLAEGVETQEEWNLVKEFGCDSVQGYFIARPMTAEAFTEWLMQHWRQ
ncbi:MAG: EAL domain-containing protein [Alphaproteobacteria bacterium]|nr:EAL domain-containing protein [Alphaproteobacteria bacterium]